MLLAQSAVPLLHLASLSPHIVNVDPILGLANFSCSLKVLPQHHLVLLGAFVTYIALQVDL